MFYYVAILFVLSNAVARSSALNRADCHLLKGYQGRSHLFAMLVNKLIYFESYITGDCIEVII